MLTLLVLCLLGMRLIQTNFEKETHLKCYYFFQIFQVKIILFTVIVLISQTNFNKEDHYIKFFSESKQA
jgi:hypothetical protein